MIKINVKFFSAAGHTAQAPFQTTPPVGMGLQKGGLRDLNRPLIVRAPSITPIKHPPQLSPITLNPQPTSINQGEGSGLRPAGEGKRRGRERAVWGRGRSGPSARRGVRARGLPFPKPTGDPTAGLTIPRRE